MAPKKQETQDPPSREDIMQMNKSELLNEIDEIMKAYEDCVTFNAIMEDLNINDDCKKLSTEKLRAIVLKENEKRAEYEEAENKGDEDEEAENKGDEDEDEEDEEPAPSKGKATSAKGATSAKTSTPANGTAAQPKSATPAAKAGTPAKGDVGKKRGAEEEPEPFASKKNKTNQKGEAGPSKVEKEANVPPFVPKPTPYDEDLAKLTAEMKAFQEKNAAVQEAFNNIVAAMNGTGTINPAIMMHLAWAVPSIKAIFEVLAFISNQKASTEDNEFKKNCLIVLRFIANIMKKFNAPMAEVTPPSEPTPAPGPSIGKHYKLASSAKPQQFTKEQMAKYKAAEEELQAKKEAKKKQAIEEEDVMVVESDAEEEDEEFNALKKELKRLRKMFKPKGGRPPTWASKDLDIDNLTKEKLKELVAKAKKELDIEEEDE